MLRGGTWNNNDNNVRSSNRNRNNPTNTNNNIGFRCSRLLPEIFNENTACSRMCRVCCGCERWRSLSAETRANIK
ncbi:MAG: hypothetical protein ACOYZ8_03520 [Chloroflexota bacterium]